MSDQAAAACGHRHAHGRRLLQVRCSLLLLLVIGFGSLLQLSYAKKKYCGPHLDRAIAEICRHGVNSYALNAAVGPGKRKANDLDEQQDSKLYTLEANELLYPHDESTGPLLVSLYGSRMLQIRRRRGIYEECCRNSCSYSELAAYCSHIRL